ncbi:MAG: D-2-hydroxyacid dehydrogenase [Planctomycetota bacterium]|nr:MAG: D-2-hydroxyacid dehydrogenase [Planctomycetota bacterium]
MSNTPHIVVLDEGTIDLDASVWDDLRRIGRVTLHRSTPLNDPAAIATHIADADIVLSNKVPLTADTIAKSPQLRMIGVLATGYNIVDLAAAQKAGICVCNVPNYSTPSVAQHTLALILECCNNVGRHSQAIRQGAWVDSEFFYFADAPLVELRGRCVGLIGFGTIAQEVGRLCSAFGAHVLAYRRNPGAAPDYGPFTWADSIDQIIHSADVVSLHCPLTPDTQGMIDGKRLQQMKSSAFLINTARGALVDEAALVNALRQGHIAAAALDVSSVEPMPADSPLHCDDLPNLFITPHNGWASEESKRLLLQITADNIRRFLEGKPVNVVS